MGDPVLRLLEPEFVEHHLETIPILREVDRIEAGADDRNARGDESVREVERRLAAVLDDASDHAAGSILDVDAAAVEALDDVQDVFEGQRLEEELVAGVVVGRDRLRIGVDHDRVEAHLRRRETRLAAAVVELDPLPDPVGSAAEDHDLRPTADA